MRNTATAARVEALEWRWLLAGVPTPDHIVIVIEENHGYSDIIGSSAAPYINSLAQQGASFSNFHAIVHGSLPNYLALFSGSTQGITDQEAATFNAPNLGTAVINSGRSFAGYSEDLPAVGSTVLQSGQYVRRHNPWVDFSNVPVSANKPFAGYFPSDYTQLPTVSFVVPNLDNDMHDGTIQQGDQWLQQKIGGYATWAKTHNSLLVVTFDEGLESDDTNHIALVVSGQSVQPGVYTQNANFYSLLRTVEDMYVLPYAGASATATPITNIWTSSTSIPSAPASLTTTAASGSQINLAWLNTASNQTGFQIERSTNGTQFSVVGTVGASATTFNDTGLAGGTKYYYQVRATNSAGVSTPSNVASATTLASTGKVYLSDLNWTSATVGYSTIKKDRSSRGNTLLLRGTSYLKGIGTHAVSQIVYNIGKQYSSFVSDVGVDDEVAGQGSVVFKVIGDGVTLYTSPMLTGSSVIQHINVNVAGVQQLTLLASNGIANNIDYDHADWADAQLLSGTSAPSAPSNLVASAASASQINLTWVNTTANQTGIRVEHSTDGTNFSLLANVGASATSYSDTGLISATKYYYRVIATSAAGSSAPSNVGSATTSASQSAATYLSNLTWASATSGWGTIQKDRSVNNNTLTLNGATYAKGIGTHAISQIVYNIGGQYSSFLADVGIDDETGNGAVGFKVIGDNGAVLFDSGVLTQSSAVVHINVSVAGVQQLTLLATNGVAGSIDYDHADWADARLLGAVSGTPAAPSNVVATGVSSSAINLSWNNTSGNLTGVRVERSTDGVNFATRASLGGSATSYADTGLAASTKYYYRVVAINSAGSSLPSSIANATTFAAASTTTYISDLNWTSATVGYGTINKDKSSRGNTISLRGTSYPKGIGTHADSTIVYKLGGAFSTFASDIGIDDEVSGNGAVIFQVIGDNGTVLYDSGLLSGASAIAHINVSVAGVQSLSLVVKSATPGSIDYDHADWAGARLLS